MTIRRLLPLILFLIIIGANVGCADQSPTPAPTDTAISAAPTDTAVSPSPTNSPQPTDTIAPSPTPIPGIIDAANKDLRARPKVVGQNPPPGAEMEPDDSIEIYFDQPMDPDLTKAALNLRDTEGNLVDVEVTWPQPRVMKITPARPLKGNARYEATVDETAVSAEGTNLLEGITLSFDTIGHIFVSQISPADNTRDVLPGTSITVIFNRPVVPLLMTPDEDSLPNPLAISPSVSGQGEWINTSVYVFRPNEPLLGRETYTVNVLAEVVNEANTTGAAMQVDHVSTFTIIPPTFRSFGLVGVSSYYVRNNYDNMRLEQDFQLAFNQPMEPTSTEAAISLVSETGSSVAFEFDWNEAFTGVVFTPTQLLELDTKYTFTLLDEARSAEGGRLSSGHTWSATTIPYPEIISTTPEDRTTQENYSSVFKVKFNARMDPDSMAGKIIIDPPISGDPDGLYDRWDWSQRYYGFEPSTTYNITVLPGMKDIYGNEVLEGRTLQFRTAPLRSMAFFNFPNDVTFYRPGGPSAAWVTYRNINQLDVDLYRLDLSQFSQMIDSGLERNQFAPTDQVVWSQSVPLDVAENTKAYKRFDMLNLDDSALTPGLYFMTLDTPQIEHTRNHLQTQLIALATANITLKTTSTEAMMWLTDLETGRPVPGVTVALYSSSGNFIFSQESDENGLVYQDGLDLGTGYRQNYYAITEGHDDVFAVTNSLWNDGVQPYDFGIYTDYWTEINEPTAYVYTDRPIYRPGQPVSFKGVIRLNDDLDYSLPEYDQVRVIVRSYDELVLSELIPLSEFGTFVGEITLDDEAALGYYRITIETEGDEHIGGGGFDVAEYRKPTFQVTAQPQVKDVLVGDTIQVTADAQFFSGGSVVNGQANWYVRSRPYYFSAGSEFRRYSFRDFERDRYYYGSGPYNPTTTVAEDSGTTDGRGQIGIDIPAELNEDQGSRRFDVEVTVTDIAGNAVSGRTDVVVHRSLLYPGIRPGRTVATAESETNLDLVVVDWEGQTIANQPVTVEVVERRWYSVQEENEEGQTIWRSTVEEIPVFETEATMNAEGQATVSFVPPEGGVYRAYVRTQDSQGNTAVSSTYFWASGRGYVPWRRVNDHSFDLIADSDSYSPGDVAEILIASPFQGDAYALVTVERGHIREMETLPLTSNSTIYRLPITGDMAPNIFVSVVVVKGVDENNITPDFKIGMTQFTVEREEQELDITITSDREVLGAGDTVNYTIEVKDFQGNPVDAEISMSLADLAALSIADPNSEPILTYFYHTRWLGIRTALMMTRLIDDFNRELEEEIKGGGGGGDGFGVLTIRENFLDTAYWAGQVQTGDDGIAEVSIDLPDNLTTWRMDVRAVTKDTLVGQAEHDIVTTRPLLVSPQTPRFFVVGDKAQVGTAVHNNSDAPIEATVTLQAEGIIVTSSDAQVVTIPAKQQAFVHWDVEVPDVERADFVFTVTGGGFSDASRPTLGTLPGQGIPVYKFEVSETVGSSGQLTDGDVIIESIGLPIYADYELTEGNVTVKLSASLVSAMTDGLDYLQHYNHECTEQVVSKFLPNVVTTQALKAAGLSDPDLEAALETQVNIALQKLYTRQRADGGWPWWSGLETNTLTSAYVVFALMEAQEAGYTVSDGVINSGVRYLRRQIDDVDDLTGRFRLNRQTFVAYVLAQAGEPPADHLSRLFDERQELDLYARAYLAQAIYLMDAEDPRLETLLSDFINAATISASGTHWEEGNGRDYWNWNSNTRTTGIILDTFAKLDADNPLATNAARWLMAHRIQGRWSTTQDTAWALMGLTEWMVASGELEADYLYEVAVNGQLQGSGHVTAENLRETREVKVDIAEMLTNGDLNRVAIGRSEGPGNLYYSTHLQAALPAAQIEAVDRGIIIERNYYDPEDRENPVTEMTQGQTFLARLTVVVPNTLHYVLIEDFLPAGLEVVDTSLKTSEQIGAPSTYDWDDYFNQGWGWWYFDHIELRDEMVVLSADYLPRGTYDYTYLVRASTPGEFGVIPPVAQEFYFPEVYGRGAGSMFIVKPR